MELKFVQNIMKLLKETDVRELEMEEDKVKIYLKKGNGVAIAHHPAPVAVAEEAVEVKEYVEVKSKKIGKYFYKNKDGEALFQVGQAVEEGAKLGYVDTMGIKNEVIANATGTITEIFVKNGGVADYGKVLVKIEKN